MYFFVSNFKKDREDSNKFILINYYKIKLKNLEKDRIRTIY